MHEDNLSKYDSVKNELGRIYDHIAEGTQFRSKCDWYGHGEILTNFFFELRKTMTISKHNKKDLLLMIKKLQSEHIF